MLYSRKINDNTYLGVYRFGKITTHPTTQMKLVNGIYTTSKTEEAGLCELTDEQVVLNSPLYDQLMSYKDKLECNFVYQGANYVVIHGENVEGKRAITVNMQVYQIEITNQPDANNETENKYVSFTLRGRDLSKGDLSVKV